MVQLIESMHRVHGKQTGRPAFGGLRGVLGVLAAALLAGGCATPDKYTGALGEQPPKVKQTDQVVWSDREERWTDREGGEPKDKAEVSAELWTFEKGAIALRLKAADRLNEYRGNPHTLLIKVFQVADPNALTASLDSGLALRRLLAGDQPDPTVLAMRRVILEPGGEQLVLLDRAQLASYLVIVAGYNDLDVRSGVRIVPIPGIRDYPVGLEQLQPANVVSRLNPWGDKPPARPARLELWLELGENKIDKLEGRAK